MLVQALASYADVYLSEQLNDAAWERKPVPYLLEIGSDGGFLGIVPRLRQETRGKKTISLAETLTVPKSPVNRNSAISPLLAADDIKYLLGPGPWTGKKDSDKTNAAERHEAFASLIRKAADSSKDAGLLAAAAFYDRPDQVEAARLSFADVKAGTLVALSAGGPLVLRKAVQVFWREHFQSAFSERVEAGGIGECLITGKVGPIAPTHEKIKGTAALGGQASGVALMSFDKPSFRSYRWEQNANSPLCPDRANAYVLALNDLLRSGRRKDIAGVGFIYWTRLPSAFDPYRLFDADPVQVADLLALDREAKPDPNMFYMAGLCANGARLIVRYWVVNSLDRVKRNVALWFEGLRIVAPNGTEASPPKLWHLQYALDREGEPPSRRAIALVRRAIEGASQPLGYDMLSALLARLRHPPESKPDRNKDQEYRFTPSRMALLRLCLNDLLGNEEPPMTEALDPGLQAPAYVCGRLLAEYENLQDAVYRTAGETTVNESVADRYYALASVRPATAFPRIETLAKAHFKKLRTVKKPGAMGTYIAIERKVTRLHEEIGSKFPGLLNLEGQGRFALGYYHQKAENWRQKYAAKQQQSETEENFTE